MEVKVVGGQRRFLDQLAKRRLVAFQVAQCLRNTWCIAS